jgi:hypothetical protein
MKPFRLYFSAVGEQGQKYSFEKNIDGNYSLDQTKNRDNVQKYAKLSNTIHLLT